MVRKNIEVMVITVQSWVYYLGITAMKHTVVTKAHAVIKLTFGGCETLNSEQIVEQIKTKTNSFKKFDIIDKHANWDSNIVFKVVQRGHKKKLFTENFTDKFDMSVFHTSMHVRTNSPSTGSWDNRDERKHLLTLTGEEQAADSPSDPDVVVFRPVGEDGMRSSGSLSL